MSEAPALDRWLDRFFATYYRHHPVNATFVGIHDYDHLLPDYSAAGVRRLYDAIDELLESAAALPEERPTISQQIDLRLACGFLRIRRWELGAPQFQAGNPSVYTGEAAFGILSLLRRPFAPLSQRLDAAAARLAAIPALFGQAETNLRQAPAVWTARARQECTGLLNLLRDGLPALLTEASAEHPRLLRAANVAAAATAHYDAFLATLPDSDTYACGAEAFALLLREAHCLTWSAQDIAAYAARVIATCDATLRDRAPAFGSTDWRDVLPQLASLHPTAEKYLSQYTNVWNACRSSAAEHDLVTWPDYPLRYQPRPQWVRSAAPHLYFLFYHAPPAFDTLDEIDYLVTPIDDAPDQDALLRAINDSVIKLNHVVHHGAIGHHVQNWHAYNRATSRFGKMAAVDCASRIAMQCAGTMAEGWACYATDLMAEHGFLTPLEEFAETHGRLRMAARALADVRLHHGEWTLEQTAQFYADTVGMPPAAARAEAVKNSMFPATAMMYLIGTDAIHDLRREYAAQPGFSLRKFHDSLLGYGSIPVALIAEAMRAEYLLSKEVAHAE